MGLEAEELYFSPEVNSDNPVFLFLYNPKFSHSTKKSMIMKKKKEGGGGGNENRHVQLLVQPWCFLVSKGKMV